jgi:hypothetical protein
VQGDRREGHDGGVAGEEGRGWRTGVGGRGEGEEGECAGGGKDVDGVAQMVSGAISVALWVIVGVWRWLRSATGVREARREWEMDSDGERRRGRMMRGLM